MSYHTRPYEPKFNYNHVFDRARVDPYLSQFCYCPWLRHRR